MSNKSYRETQYSHNDPKSWFDRILENNKGKPKKPPTKGQKKTTFTEAEKVGMGIGVVVVIGIIIYFIFK